MPTPLKERLARLFVGTRDAETGQRHGGIAEAFRGGNGQMMMNPISAAGDRIGRRVAGWVNDKVNDRRYNRYMQGLYDQETPQAAQATPQAPTRNAPPILGTPRQSVPMTAAQRNAAVFRGNQAVNPSRDISARTSRSEGASAFDDTVKAYEEAVKRNSWMQNQMQ